MDQGGQNASPARDRQEQRLDFTEIRYEVADHVATITLDRPERLNAYTRTMHEELIAGVRPRRRGRRRARRDRDRCRPRLLRGRRPRGRRRDVRLDQAAGPRRDGGGEWDRRAPRRRRDPHAADLPLHQARDRRDQRPGRGRGHHDDAGHGHAPGRGGSQDRLRVRPPRDRARGLLELVPAAHRRHLAGDGVGGHGPRVHGRGGAGRPARAQRAPGGRGAAGRSARWPPRSWRTARPCRWRWRAG